MPLIFLLLPAEVSRKETTKLDYRYYTAEKVIDGDTLRLEDGRTVRLIGIDTPESKHAEVPVQVFSKEAFEFARQMAEGFEVRLGHDRERTDKYGRTLAYVYLRDGRMLNEELLKRGYAYVLRRFPFSKEREFLNIQKQARKEQRGLWAYNLSYARLALIADRFEKLSDEGKRQFDRELDKLSRQYPQEEEQAKNED